VNEVWYSVRAMLQSEMSRQSFQSWIENRRALPLDDRTILIEAPNKFCRDYVEQNYGFKLRKLWADSDPGQRALRFGAAERRAAAPGEPRAAEPVKPAQNDTRPAAPMAAPRAPERFDRTFENFIIGPANEVAAAVARQAATDPEARFNPIYIHGGYGVGKTHLLRAIQAQARTATPDRKALYLTGEKFTAGFTSALKARDTREFKEEMRGVDLLLLDDLHIMAGKSVTQEEFYHTLADLIADGRQVVVTGDRPPAQLDGLDERLRSLLTGGLRADIESADLDLRRRILDRAVADMQRNYPNFELGAQARDFIAARVTASPRELIGALNMVISRTLLIGREATTEAVTAVLSDYAVASERRITVDRIQKQVAAYYKLDVPELLSQRRARAVARPRQIAMYLSKTMTQRSLPDIGRRFGGRDHTTVLHAVRRISELMKSDAAIHDDVEALMRLLER